MINILIKKTIIINNILKTICVLNRLIKGFIDFKIYFLQNDKSIVSFILCIITFFIFLNSDLLFSKNIKENNIFFESKIDLNDLKQNDNFVNMQEEEETGTGKEKIFGIDSVITFEPSRPLIDTINIKGKFNNGAGINLSFSTSGFGFGGFYEYKISEDVNLVMDFLMTGARNTDEFEVFDNSTGLLIVPNKLNRVFNFPISLGPNYYVFQDVLFDNFKPFLSAGIGFSTILVAPYSKYYNENNQIFQEYIQFFDAFSEQISYLRPLFYFSIGADFGFNKKNISRIQIKYFSIPFGGEGIYSMVPPSINPFLNSQPITNFGGIFITLSVGTKF